MATLADYIMKNIKTIDKMVKADIVPLSLMQNYDIYKMNISLLDVEPKSMKRYKIIANRYKISTSSVLKAIAKMKSNY